MTITIDIPAISELAAAIRSFANAEREMAAAIHHSSAAQMDSPSSGVNPDRVITHEPQRTSGFTEGQPVTADGQAADPQPAKRTRRTKAEMGAERKAIEEKLGRRMDGPTPDPVQPTTGDTGFQWTLEKLKDTFLSLPSGDVTDEMKAADDAKRVALKAIREAIAPEAQNLSTMDEKHYAEFARQATAWYREQGLELTLPEGAE